MSMAGVGGPLDVEQMAERKSDELLEQLKKEVKVELKDIGTLRKEISVTVPASFINTKLQSDYKEIRGEAVLPGFRKGRAPIGLVRRRFSGDVQKSLKTSIIGQSFLAAVQNNDLKVLGDPLFRLPTDQGVKLMELGEALPKLDVKAEHDFSYTCELEVKPTFELPALEGLEIKRPLIEITDQMVEEQVQRQLKIRGRYEVFDGAAKDSEDLVIADVTLTVDGQTINSEANVELGVRPARLDGIQLLELGDQLKGAKVGATITVDCQVPDDYVRADCRGKAGRFEFKVHEVKQLKSLTIAEFMEQTGCKEEAELRQFMKDELTAERDQIVQRALREQVLGTLIEQTKFDLPPGLSARQTDRAVMRKVIELQQQGIPPSEVEAKIDELRTSAGTEVARTLKLEFIMEKVSEQLGVTLTEEDVNAHIAAIARRYNRRFDRVRDDLAHRGLIPQLIEFVRQEKCVEKLLETARISDVAPDSESKPAPKKRKKKTDKDEE